MKNWIRIWLAIAVISLCAGAAAVCAGRSFEIKGASDAACDRDNVYFIDNQGVSYDIVHSGRDGRIQERITVQKLNGAWWNYYRYLTVDRTGEVYVYCYGTSEEDGAKRSAVYRCDFERERLELAWELPSRRLCGISVVDGMLYYGAPSERDPEKTDFYRLPKGGAPSEREGVYKGTLLGTFDFPYSHMVSSYYNPETGAAVWSDYHGKLYKNGVEIRTERDSANERAHIAISASGITYTDLADSSVKRIARGQTEEKKQFSLDNVEVEDLGLSYSDLIPLRYYQDGTWLAGVDLDGENRVLGIFDGTGKRLQLFRSLTEPWQVSAEEGLRVFSLTFFALSVVAGCCVGFLHRTGGVIPVLVKLLVGLVPVILLCTSILGGQIEKHLEKRIVKIETDLLYEIANQNLNRWNPRLLKSLDISRIPESLAYRELFGAKGTGTSSVLTYSEKTKPQPITSRTYQWLYLLDGGELKYVVVDDNYYGGRVSYYRDRAQMALIEHSIEQKIVTASQYNDQEGNWVVLYVPVLDEKGEALGVLESGMSYGAVLYEVRLQVNRLRTMTIGMAAAMTVMMLFILGASLRPLSRLKKAVESMAQGNLGQTVKASGRDEIAGISRAFNQMSAQLKEQVEFISACSRGYEKFVPKKMFEILNRRDITQVELGDQKEIEASLMSVNAVKFNTFEKIMTGEELFATINQIMGIMIPAAVEREGVVDRMADAGITAFYTSGSEPALQSAVSICEKLNFLRQEHAILPRFRIAVACGTIRLGIVGEAGREAASVISDLLPLTEHLQQMGETYGARILITGRAAEQIPGFETSYHSRMIGYLYIEASDSLEALYDVYDGDIARQRRLKEDTRELFGEAVKDYLEEKYYEARQKFVRIVKQNRDDKAAREYARRCDAYYQMSDRSSIQTYLDKY